MRTKYFHANIIVARIVVMLCICVTESAKAKKKGFVAYVFTATPPDEWYP